MEIYFLILAILLVLAVSGLVVGVSNDAVNFLNSALGSKAAPRYVILIVASVGIILGAVFSTGMMEIARKGMFYPEMFYLKDIMMIFLAVMFADVILLDLFNTFGLPTSTTVSLIFNLLGAAVAVALVKIWGTDGARLSDMGSYINAGKALGIISAILSSVVIALVAGTIVMYITRLIFSFRYHRTFRYLGSLWCGAALTAITYFAIFKGLKDTTMLSPELVSWLDANTGLFILGSLIGWTLLMMLIQFVLRWNILKITVLAGTLSLALAFAGNDLVNFIGVFVAGYDSYTIAGEAAAAGVDLSTLKMVALSGDGLPTSVWILLSAGAIMVFALWTSKKARSVSDTEINLARQDDGAEHFGSTGMSRALVRGALNFNRSFERYVPRRVQRFIAHRFRPAPEVASEEKAPFDLIRATVNLSVASILIASATALRLPLSTTYVTFMVAMGTSLADRAWGRESAVYRITGVLTVIAGWFLTAIVAFALAFIIALVLMYGGTVAIFVLSALCVLMLIQSKLIYSRRKKKAEQREAIYKKDREIDILDEATVEVSSAMEKMSSIYKQTIEGLFNEDRKLLRDTMREADQMYQEAHERKYGILPILRRLEANHVETGHYYVQVADYINEVAKALVHITRPSFEHIDNNHEGLSRDQLNDLRQIADSVNSIYHEVNHMIQTNDFSAIDDTLHHRDELFEVMAAAIKKQIYRVRDSKASSRTSMLYLDIINETKTMVLQARNLLKAQKHFIQESDATDVSGENDDQDRSLPML